MASKSINLKFNHSSSYNTTDIPSDIKQLLEDKDQNGIPDFADKIAKDPTTDTHTEIEINGKKYTSWADVPKEFQSFNLNPYTTDSSSKAPKTSDPQSISKPLSQANSGKPLFDTKTIIIAFLIIVIVYLLLK